MLVGVWHCLLGAQHAGREYVLQSPSYIIQNCDLTGRHIEELMHRISLQLVHVFAVCDECLHGVQARLQK